MGEEGKKEVPEEEANMLTDVVGGIVGQNCDHSGASVLNRIPSQQVL